MLKVDINRLDELPAVEIRTDGNLDSGDPLLQLKYRDLPRPVISVGLQHFDHVFSVRVLSDKEQALEVLGFTVMYWSGPNRIFNATLQKMAGKLREVGYAGSIDINCIVNKNGIFPLEFTARFGYPAITIQQDGMVTTISDLLYGVASGELTEFEAKRGFQVGVRIVVPPFPFDDSETFESHSKNAAILFKKRDRSGVHIEDVKCINGQWFVAGDSGVVLVVVGTGQTVRQAQKEAYKRIANVMIPGMYYRTDVGNRWFEDCDKLHTWGYLREV